MPLQTALPICYWIFLMKGKLQIFSFYSNVIAKSQSFHKVYWSLGINAIVLKKVPWMQIKYTTVSPKESIHFCRAEYLNIRGADEKKGVHHTLYWAGPNWDSFWNSKKWLHTNIFGISKRGLVHFGLTQWWVLRNPYFSSGPPGFWVLGFDVSVYFIFVPTVHLNSENCSKVFFWHRLLWLRLRVFSWNFHPVPHTSYTVNTMA